MGLTYADVKLSNRLTGESLDTRVLVDSGASYLCVPAKLALQLGFDLEEAEQLGVTLADGQVKIVPKIEPIRIAFENRTCTTEALVLGDEPLMGVLPIEAMDLILDAKRQMLKVNPEHPNFPVFHAKGFQHR